MLDFEVDSLSAEQASRCRKLFSAVVLASLDEWIEESEFRGVDWATNSTRLWAESKDGRTILMSAGIESDSRTTKALMDFVSAGVRTARSLRGNNQMENTNADAEATGDQPSGYC